MYFKSSRPSLLPAPRPAKRRRRTATAVLGGYFDPRPERDFFTDMANSSDTHNPYNSVVGHGPGILFDVRSQEEKEVELAREHKRLVKNAKRKERDIEKRREREEQKSKKAQKRAERMRETAQAKAAQRIGEVNNTAQGHGIDGISPPNPSGTVPPSTAPPLLPPRVSALLSPFEAGPSSEWSPYCRVPHEIHTYPSQGPFIPRSGIIQSPVVTVQSATPPRPGDPPPPTARALAISISPRLSSLLPLSPPTPSRSISSYTSRTSSKRPHTPDDDDMQLTHMHTDNENEYPMYSPLDEDVHMIDGSSFGHTSSGKGKWPLRPTTPRSHLADPGPPIPAASSAHSHASFGPSSWIASQASVTSAMSIQATPISPWMAGNNLQSTSPESSSGVHTQASGSRTSTSHRRDALSLAALLTEPSYGLSRSRPFVPPTPEAPPTVELRLDSPGTSVDAIADQLPEPAVVAPSTVGSSCLSPLAEASPVGNNAALTPTGGFNDNAVEEASLVHIPLAILTAANEVADTMRSNLPGHEESVTLDCAVEQISRLESRPQREPSTTPETSEKDKGRRSKAMLIIESEDELTDLEDLDTTLPKLKSSRGKAKSARSAWKSVTLSSALREQSLTGEELLMPATSASPSVFGSSALPQRRKRPAARKGWKGWVEVEVEVDEDVPVRQISLDLDPPPTLGERRTRSGRHFDA